MNDLEKLIARVKIHVKDDAGCWIWQGYCNRGVFPVISVKGNPTSVRRTLWSAIHGEVDKKFEVVNKCECAKCVSPDCLKLVTKATRRKIMAQSRDAASYAKSNAGIRAKAKLSFEKVREIRASDLPNTVLAERYGVVHQVISEVRLGKSWVEPSPWTGLGAR